MNILARNFLTKRIAKIYEISKSDAKQIVSQIDKGVSIKDAIENLEEGLYQELIDDDVNVYDIFPEIGKQMKWNMIAGMVFQVIDFDRGDTYYDTARIAQNDDQTKPYGYLIVKSATVSQPTKLPIIHRDDYMLADLVFGDEDFKNIIIDSGKHELLVTYVPELMNSAGYSMSPTHCLHYSIEPKGTLDNYYNGDKGLERMRDPEPEIIFGDFVYGPFEYITVKNIDNF